MPNTMTDWCLVRRQGGGAIYLYNRRFLTAPVGDAHAQPD